MCADFPKWTFPHTAVFFFGLAVSSAKLEARDPTLVDRVKQEVHNKNRGEITSGAHL